MMSKFSVKLFLLGFLLTSYNEASAQTFQQDPFCDAENMEPVKEAINYPKKWDLRLEEAAALRAEQGELDKTPPDSFDRATETSHPIVVMPTSAIKRRGSRGACRTIMDIQADGTPVNLLTACTHGRYKRSATKAIREARYVPAFQNGVPVTKYGSIVPMDFCFVPFDD